MAGVSKMFKMNNDNKYSLNMKKMLLLAAVLAIAAFATKIIAANESAPAMSGMSCCAGMAGCNMMTPVSDSDTNAIPDKLKTCPVSGEKLGGDMGKPFRFVYQGQEVLLCCKSCKKDFDKEPAKYIKLIRAADKKAEAK